MATQIEAESKSGLAERHRASPAVEPTADQHEVGTELLRLFHKIVDGVQLQIDGNLWRQRQAKRGIGGRSRGLFCNPTERKPKRRFSMYGAESSRNSQCHAPASA